MSPVTSVRCSRSPSNDNPVRGLERNPDIKRKRYLSPDEIARLTGTLAEHKDQQAANIVRLLLFTGARRMEVMSAMWSQFDLEKGEWTKPGATTKQKTDHHVPLNAPARELLERLRSNAPTDAIYLFPGRGTPHRMDIKKNWAELCKAAGFSNARVHDLRHSFASTLAGAGLSLPVIGALLGHTQAATTHRC